MILYVSGRTDIVAYYTKWFLKRLEEGFCYVRNPISPKVVYKYDLSPNKVDCIIFCSKNYAPILPYIQDIQKNYDIICHYTITAYGKDIEPNVPSIDVSIDTLIRLSSKIGSKHVIWRYDPLLLTQNYDVKYLVETFEYILSKIYPYIERVVFSFVEEYAKLKRNMPNLISLSEEDKKHLVSSISQIAQRYQVTLQTCGTNESFKDYGVLSSGCTTKEILSTIFGKDYQYKKEQAKRVGCRCMPSRDIGEYDSCIHGCAYCYANQSPKKAFETIKQHHPDQPLLLGRLECSDIVKDAKQESFICDQITLFDL